MICLSQTDACIVLKTGLFIWLLSWLSKLHGEGSFFFILICILANINYAKPLNLNSLWYLIKQVKGLSKEDLAARDDLVTTLPERIQAIPDGTTTAAKQTGGWGASASHKNIKFDSPGASASVIHLESQFLMIWTFQLIVNTCLFHYQPQVEILTVIFSNKLKNQVNLDKNMKCGKWNRHVRFLIIIFMSILQLDGLRQMIWLGYCLVSFPVLHSHFIKYINCRIKVLISYQMDWVHWKIWLKIWMRLVIHVVWFDCAAIRN